MSHSVDLGEYKSTEHLHLLPPKRGSWRFIRESSPLMLLTAPIVYALIVTLVALDVFMTGYQAVVFPIYGIAKVNRSEYIVIDRQLLPYLNLIQKINCAYCGYANGLLGYAREIASRSEENWCPIKHAINDQNSHPRHQSFCDYGDEWAFHRMSVGTKREPTEGQ